MTASQDIAVPASGRLRLGVISDTHGHPHPEAAQLLAREAPDLVLHAGDIGDGACLDAFAAVAPLIVVRGNIDEPDDGVDGWPERRLLRVTSGGHTALVILLTHIAVYGSRLRAEIQRDARHLGADLVVCGHSHVPLVASDHGVAVFNPGSCGPKRFSLPITVGLVDIAPDGVSFRHLDCVTGERWRP
ncbi:MAG: metallophosphoesterase [Deltaproteobacteria bacterium]|nr:MAG: metallophosphoesterase [Deltaproteobacteria bacterium]